MRPRRHGNIDNLLAAARLLGDLTSEVVFVGGAATALLLTDSAAPDVRPTLDVDVIVEVASRSSYHRFQERLRERGFSEALDEEVICRWKHGEIILDVMPTDESILGFSNPWYLPAISHSQDLAIEDVHLRVISAPYFLGTKVAAFFGRGKGDYMASHDLEDIVIVLDGRPEIVQEVLEAPEDLRRYLGSTFAAWLALDDFLDGLPGLLLPDPGSQARVPVILDRMRRISVGTTLR
ncbi:MAG: hypothetical protein FD177_2707 [Desulfovibrionaceae bacterium]|nr:MAG: hypothetical protein FD177_2707 [Desulfovibrionaceae bacterium]